MGKLCSREVQSETSELLPQEGEVSIPTYKSDGDKYFEGQEKKFNLLKNMPYEDYLFSLVNFSLENATLEDDYSKTTLEHSSNDPFYSETFSSDYFQSFIENKLLKHKLLYDEAQNNETSTSIFKTNLLHIYKGLAKKLSQDIKEKTKEDVDMNSVIIKGYLIPLGILLCTGPKYVKIKTIFNLFRDGDNLKYNEKLSQFFLSLFLTACSATVYARNKLSDFEEIGGIEEKELLKILDSSELKDSQHLVEVTNKLIFGDDLSQSLDYPAFKAKFADDNKNTSLGFMLSAPGVRFMQKKYNV